MKAADISDAALLDVVRSYNEGHAPDQEIRWPNRPEWMPRVISGPRWALIWDLEEAFPAFPQKVILAKCRSLIRRGLLDGCTCGCRGDFEIPR